MGHRPVSLRHVAGASHLAVQQRPEGVADAIGLALDEEAQYHLRELARSRL
jgi:hypothetical protein